MTVTCYPVAGKAKSTGLCEAFARGCGGRMGWRYAPGPAMFYGVDASNMDAWLQVLGNGDDFYYVDNSYFDHTRGSHFRVTKNRLQAHWDQDSDGARWAMIEEPLLEWADPLGHVVVCPQSESFMRDIARYPGSWLGDTMRRLQDHKTWTNTNRIPRIVVKAWNRDKKAASASLQDDLRGARLLVTHSSAAAVTAAILGVPVEVNPPAALWYMPFTLMNRLRAMRALADNQWTLAEIRSGLAWEKVK
jgi:hypothetical protein